MKKGYQTASTLAHCDEDATIEMSTHAGYACLPGASAAERWSKADLSHVLYVTSFNEQRFVTELLKQSNHLDYESSEILEPPLW